MSEKHIESNSTSAKRGSNDADYIAELCYNFYLNLPKSGKPNVDEWTSLTCILKSDDFVDYEVVSLGTGTKCIGKSKLSDCGDILNDSHSEVMARRGLMRYLYEQIAHAFNKKESIFVIDENGKCCLKAKVLFHFFSTQSPCGDASIIDEKISSHIDGETIVVDSIDKRIEEIEKTSLKRSYSCLQDNTVGFQTGAKCLKLSDRQEDFVKQSKGMVRLKPGRGDPTLSVSCSDKLARWIRVGFQGALLATFLNEPIRIHSIIISGDTPFSMTSFYRCLVDRSFDGHMADWDVEAIKGNERGDLQLPVVIPTLAQSTLPFQHSSAPDKNPSPCSIVWCKVTQRQSEVAVAGRKLGATKKNLSQSSLLISKRNFFKEFMSTIKTIERNGTNIKLSLPNELSYRNAKLSSHEYNKQWLKTKEVFFKEWPAKPEALENFKIT